MLKNEKNIQKWSIQKHFLNDQKILKKCSKNAKMIS